MFKLGRLCLVGRPVLGAPHAAVLAHHAHAAARVRAASSATSTSHHRESGFASPVALRSLSTTAGRFGSGAAVPSDALCDHPANNVPPHIAGKLGRNLHRQRNHPLAIIRETIEGYWQERHAGLEGAPPFSLESGLHPVGVFFKGWCGSVA